VPNCVAGVDAALIGKEDYDVRFENLLGAFGRGPGDVEHLGLASQPPGQAVQGLRAGFALDGVGRLNPGARCLRADDQRNHQHSGKCNQVGVVGYTERQIRRDTEKVECRNAQE
jgi:hypothetical protein